MCTKVRSLPFGFDSSGSQERNENFDFQQRFRYVWQLSLSLWILNLNYDKSETKEDKTILLCLNPWLSRPHRSKSSSAPRGELCSFNCLGAILAQNHSMVEAGRDHWRSEIPFDCSHVMLGYHWCPHERSAGSNMSRLVLTPFKSDKSLYL